MLTQNELANLQDIISDDTKTFEDLKNLFNNNFEKSSHFKAGLTLSILIKDHQLNLSQELSAFYLLYCLSEKEKGFSPYESVVIDILKETKIKSKKIFLIDYLKNNILNTEMKVKDYIKFNEKNDNNRNIEEEINIIIKNYNKEDKLNINNDLLINPLVQEKSIIENKINNNNFSKLTSQEKFFDFLEPNYMSYYPSRSNEILFNNELKWIFPMMKHNFIWENATFEKVNFLLNKILNNTPLTKDENKYIISSISKNPNLIKQINFSPNKMMFLIEKDESLSFEILSIICKISLNE